MSRSIGNVDRQATRYATLTADVLRRLARRPQAPAQRPHGLTPSHRAETTAALEHALAHRAKGLAVRRLVYRGGVALSAAAVVAFASLGVLTRHHAAEPSADSAPTASLSADQAAKGTNRTLTVDGLGGERAAQSSDRTVVTGNGNTVAASAATRSMHIDPGTLVTAPKAGEVRIGAADGTQLTLEKGGVLMVEEQTSIRRFALKSGAVRVRVAPLQSGERFIVATNDVEVEVHGTVFRVAVALHDDGCGMGVRTRVSVQEGVVSVRAAGSEAFVSAGSTWPEPCAHNRAAAAPTGVAGKGVFSPTLVVKKERSASRRRHHSASRGLRLSRLHHPAAPVSPSTVDSAELPSALAAQNDLFAAAIRAKREQRVNDSVRLFSELVETYPDGPLAEGAMAQRMQLLARTDAPRAADAANGYLRRFPSGFARAEARRLVDSSPP